MDSKNAEVLMYDVEGNETSDINLAVAKQVSLTQHRFFIRNKQGLLIDIRQILNKSFNDKEYPFVMVTQDAFEQYISFLKTRNGSRLNIAERKKHGSY